MHGCFLDNSLELWQGQQWRRNLDSLVRTEAWPRKEKMHYYTTKPDVLAVSHRCVTLLRPRVVMITWMCLWIYGRRGKFMQCTWAEKPWLSGAEPWRWREHGARLLQFRSLLQRSWLFLLSFLWLSPGKFRLSLTSFPVGQSSVQQNKGPVCVSFTHRKIVQQFAVQNTEFCAFRTVWNTSAIRGKEGTTCSGRYLKCRECS